MTTLAQVRKAALALPETQELATDGSVAFAVCGQRFASASPDGRLRLWLPDDDVDTALAAQPTAERAGEGSRGSGIRIPLVDIDGQAVNHWVRRAWFHRAPASLARVLRAADAARPGAVGDLPGGIGAPATRALAGAGVTSLADVACRTEVELGELHGVGPKALRILGESLTAAGLAFSHLLIRVTVRREPRRWRGRRRRR